MNEIERRKRECDEFQEILSMFSTKRLHPPTSQIKSIRDYFAWGKQPLPTYYDKILEILQMVETQAGESHAAFLATFRKLKDFQYEYVEMKVKYEAMARRCESYERRLKDREKAGD